MIRQEWERMTNKWKTSPEEKVEELKRDVIEGVFGVVRLLISMNKIRLRS